MSDYRLWAPPTFGDSDLRSLFDELRTTGALSWSRGPGERGFWSAWDFDTIDYILKNPAVFASREGMFLSTVLNRGDSASGRMIVVTDPPDHRSIRTVLQSAVRLLDEPVAEAADRAARDTVAQAVAAGSFDAVRLSSEIACRVACALVGIPEEMWSNVEDLSLLAVTDAGGGDGGLERNRSVAHLRLMNLLSGIARERAKSPRRDLVSLLTQVDESTDFSFEDLVLNALNVVIGATATSRQLVAGSLKLWADGCARIPRSAQEVDEFFVEALRYLSPPLHIVRTAEHDCRVGEVAVRAGDAVACWIPAGNWDPKKFSQPHEFQPQRGPRRNLTFGAGPHFCLGAGVARAEFAAVVRHIADVPDEFSLTGEPSRLASVDIYGFDKLPMAFGQKSSPSLLARAQTQ
ncbi:MAG: cytochrome P450 [Nocardioides sp.]|nr:cytochrome P450 [Nocardioides sp.]